MTPSHRHIVPQAASGPYADLLPHPMAVFNSGDDC
jgi:hypothetical protein